MSEQLNQYIFRRLMSFIGNYAGAAGLMGNLYAESGLKPNNLQNSYEKSLGMTDVQYTSAVDTGMYKNFANDGSGYGLAQWTFPSRKQNLLALAKATCRSIGDIDLQILYLYLELQNYSEVLDVLKLTSSIADASDKVLKYYEKPAKITETSTENRRKFSQNFYYQFVGMTGIVHALDYLARDYRVIKRGSKGEDVKKFQQRLIDLGYDIGEHGADGTYGHATMTAVKTFQLDHGLYADGIAGAVTQYIAVYLLEVKERRYTVTIRHLTRSDAEELLYVHSGSTVVLEVSDEEDTNTI